jgi:hypothetical protein
MKLDNDQELEALWAKADKQKLSLSDYLRKRVGFAPFLRGVGRPARKAKCLECGAIISASRMSKHMRLNHVV